VPENSNTFKRSMSIERSDLGVPMGYCDKERACDLSFSSETDQVWRSAGSYSMREQLGSDDYAEVLNHDDADFDFLRTSGSVLKNHDPNQIIGSIVNVSNSNMRGGARIKFTSIQAGKDAETEVREGALKSTSFGYEHKSGARIIPKGERFVHHGREIVGPAVLTGFRALEITLTPIPADSTTGVGRSKQGSMETPDMPNAATITPEVRKYCRTAGLKQGLNRSQIESVIAENPIDIEDADVSIALIKGERATTVLIPEVKPAPIVETGLSREFVKNIATRGKLANLSMDEILDIQTTSKDEADATNKIFSAVEKRGKEGGVFSSGRFEAQADSTDKAVKYVEGCLAEACKREIFGDKPDTTNRDIRKRDDNEKNFEGVDDFEAYLREFKDLGCKHRDSDHLADVFLKAFDFDTSDLSRRSKVQFLFSRECSDRVQHRTLGREGKVKLFERDNGGAAVSGTASFPFLFQNIQTKALRRMYQRWDPTWMKWTKKGSLPDFKPATRIALSDAGSLLVVKENEQPKNANFSDEAETIQLNKYARRYSFSWEAMINDDIGGMARTTMSIARAVMRKPGELLYLDLLSNPTMGDAVALFNSAHNNTQTGAMGATAVNVMAVAMMKQKGKLAPKDTDVNMGGLSDNLDIQPSIILGPPDVWYAASKLFNPAMLSQVASDGGAGAGSNFFIGNVPGVGGMSFLAEPRLSNTDYTSNSAVAFYMIANPRDIDAYEVAFLNGSSEPILTQRQDYQTLGWETVVTLPVAIKALEWRAMQYSTGS
jgi:Caudovirus prohead serine protease